MKNVHRKICVGASLLTVAAALGIGSSHFSRKSVVKASEIQAPKFEVDPFWPKIPEKILLGPVRGVAVDAQDNVRIQQELLEATALRYKIGEARYRNGLMSFQDFDTITDSYVSQQQSCISSQRDAVIAEASWEEARGLGAIP